MQQSPSELKEKLLCALDKDYNVVDMATVMQVISALEKLLITKEALEKTRLGKYINELRKRTSNEQLARRAKDLVKGWRKLIPQSENSLSNGERIAGGITPPGPGPGLATGRPGGANLNKIGLAAARKQPIRFKPASPAVSFERLASPLSLSASNSPLLLQPAVNKTNNLLSSYAPVIKSSLSTAGSSPASPIPQSLNVFKPVSPALLAVKQSLTLNRPATPDTVAHPKANSPANSLKLSPRIPSISGNASGGKLVPKNNNQQSERYSVTSATVTCITLDDNVHSSLDLAKTNPANKRLRKNSDEDRDSTNGHSHPPNKKAIIVNGLDAPETDKVKASKWSAFESVKSSSVEENSPEDPTSSADVEIVEEIPVKPKRGRRKKCKQDPHDILKEKLAAAQGSRYHKVKTTQQLIEDLHAKNVVAPGTLAVVSPSLITDDLPRIDAKQRLSGYSFLGSTDAETSRAKSELMDRFLKSTSSNSKLTSPSGSDTPADSKSNESTELVTLAMRTPAMVDQEIEKLLRSLPKVDASVLDDPDDIVYEENLVERTITPEIGDVELERLSVGQWNRVNGMYDHENEWHPWQETAALASQEGELLHILPYVNIDW